MPNLNASAMHNGMTWKRRMRVEKAARLTAFGVLSDAEIARQIGITQPAFSVLKSTNEFKKQMIQLSTGIIAQDHLAVAKSLDYQREQLADMVPIALQKIKDLVMHPKPEIALKSAMEILDRDGKHAKVSRSSVTVENHVDMNIVNATANNILNILSGAPASQPSPTMLDGSNDVTGDITQNILNQFTCSAADAKKQVEQMADVVDEKTLEEIDTGSKTIQ